jgi:hypothetical protein
MRAAGRLSAMSTETITLYHDPEQRLLHVLTARVKQDGTHKVTDSLIVSVPHDVSLPKLVAGYAEVVGAANVRAYTIAAVR